MMTERPSRGLCAHWVWLAGRPGWRVAPIVVAVLAVAGRLEAQPDALRPPPPPPEVASGGLTLMVAAYAAIWLVAFAFIGLTLRRQRQLNARIEQLAAGLHRLGVQEAPGERMGALTNSSAAAGTPLGPD